MKKQLLYIIVFLCLVQQFYSQEKNGVIAFNIPVRNSLKFNKYTFNPTFSFVREQNKYINFTNKRQWVQFDDAPQTYVFGYSGRFRENIGAGLSVFQQNYGVLTTFGGLLNFAYNVVLDTDSHLTFGVNLGFYKSGISQGRVVTNFPDSALENIPSHTVATINPGINYGTTFLDFGIAINNLASYNITASSIIEENPEQSIQAHIMYTGYMDNRGFFDESKFTTLLRSEFKKDKTIISGIAMVTIPIGIWAQVSYNSLYGVSGGIGLNISKQIALEYNYEKAIGDLVTFGNSHEITLAYRFKNKERYSYSGDDEEASILVAKKSKRVLGKKNVTPKISIEERKIAKEQAEARIEAKRQAAKVKAEKRKLAIARANKLSQESKNQEAEALKTKLEKDAQDSTKEETRIKPALEAKKKIDDALKTQQIQNDKVKKEAQDKIRTAARIKREKAEAAAKIKQQQEVKAKEEARQYQLAQIAQQKKDSIVQVKALEEQTKQLAQAKEDARIKLEQAHKLKVEKESQTKQLTKTRAEAEKAIDTILLDGVVIPIARDKEALAIENLTKLTVNSKIEQQDLLNQLIKSVASKQKDLDNLKEENNLSDQGIYKAPKPFKSISAQNVALKALKLNIDTSIKSQNSKITQLEDLYKKRLKTVSSKKDSINVYYSKAIDKLKSEQLKAVQQKSQLILRLETIKVATDFERKRRIKRAAYDNEQDRYKKDRAALDKIKQFASKSTTTLTPEDFDFGEERSNNIQIVRGVNNTESGYYLVLAVHSNIGKRDEFLSNTVAVGQNDVDFFYDVNTSQYFIYHQKFNTIEAARNALQFKGSEPYNTNMSVVKVEN